MTNEEYTEYLKSPQWKRIAHRRMEIDGFKCVACESLGTANNPLEVHHLSYRYLGNEESRIYEDLVTLCHVCHKTIHNTMNRTTSPSGRRGWKDNGCIPKLVVFDLSEQRETEWKEK
jgi:5-methylcytosine-specific restriction endonuclease McrA